MLVQCEVYKGTVRVRECTYVEKLGVEISARCSMMIMLTPDFVSVSGPPDSVSLVELESTQAK